MLKQSLCCYGIMWLVFFTLVGIFPLEAKTPADPVNKTLHNYQSTKGISDLSVALKSGRPVVVKLGADWCPPCRQMKPILTELKQELDGKAVILDLDIEKNRDLAKQFKVTLIPTTIFYDKSGKVKSVKVGFLSKQQIKREL